MEVICSIKGVKEDMDGTQMLIQAKNANVANYIIEHCISMGRLVIMDGRFISPEQRKKACVYDMRTSTGETLSLSLSMSRQYRAKGKYPEAYAACGKVIMGGLDDYMQIADVLYFAYICAAMDNPDNKIMDYPEFLDCIPDDVNYVNNLYLRITGRKKTEPSRNVSNSGREK